MITVLVYFLILVLILGAIWYIINLFPLPPPFPQVVRVVFVVIAVIIVIWLLLNLLVVPMPMLR